MSVSRSSTSVGRGVAKRLERRVHLFLFVRVSEDWTEDRAHYQTMGLDFES
jgi:GTPase